MTDEFDFFSTDCNNWNYNPFINTPNADSYNKNAMLIFLVIILII